MKKLKLVQLGHFFLWIAILLSGTSCGVKQESGPLSNQGSEDGAGDSQQVIAMLPKLINIDYFDACNRGAAEAASDLGIRLIYDGPSEPSGSEQNKFMDTWIRQGVDAICIAPNQPKTIRRFVEKAQAAGIKVFTWDSDAVESGRDLMISQVEESELGEMLMDEIAGQMNGKGEWAIAIASLDAANLNAWRRYAEARALAKYPEMILVDTVLTKEDENYARQKVETLLNAHPNLKGIIAFDSNSVPGAAEALKTTGKSGSIALTGCSTPSKMRPYLNQNILKSFFLWDPSALGDLTVRVAHAVLSGKELKEGTAIPGYGPIRFSKEDSKTVILSDPIRFTKDNIDEFDFGI
jgi:ABC-type sugar transport system substrate-binding protein